MPFKLHADASYRVAPVARTGRAAQCTYLDSVGSAGCEAGNGHGTGFTEHARRLKRPDVVAADDRRLCFIQLCVWDSLGVHDDLLRVDIINTEDRRFVEL